MPRLSGQAALWRVAKRQGYVERMTIRPVPYFAFDGTAREAMEFYQSIFGGELSVHTFGEFGMVEESDPAFDSVMHAGLEGGVAELAGSDFDERFTGEPLTKGNNLQIALFGDSVDEARGYFEALAAGGSVTTPFEHQDWGDHYGELVDKFGQSWSVDASDET